MSKQLTFSNTKTDDKMPGLRALRDSRGRYCLTYSNKNPQIAESSLYKAEFSIKMLVLFLLFFMEENKILLVLTKKTKLKQTKESETDSNKL